MTARDVMTPNPVTVSPITPVAEVLAIMHELNIRHVPVTQGGALVGIVSDRDVQGTDLLPSLSREGFDAVRARLAAPVARVMSADVASVSPDTELSEVIALMVDIKIGAVPVAELGTHEVVGIISYVDVLRVVQDMLEE